MKFLCYRAENAPSKYSYVGQFACSGSIVCTGDLAGLGNALAEYAELDGDKKGFWITGNTQEIEIEKLGHLSNPEGLPKRVLEELALIISNKSKREVLVK